MSAFHEIERVVRELSTKVPLEAFTFIGAFLEEVIAPIPSPLIMTVAGSVALAQGKSLLYLAWLACLGTTGKTLGSWVVYVISEKMENVIVNKFGKFIGITQQDVENLKRRFSGGWRDLLVLTLLRATPVVPTAPVSVVCGLIRIPMQTYLIATFIGTFVRSALYLYLGYAGLATFENIVKGMSGLENVLQAVIALLIVGFLGWLYFKRRKRS